MRLAAGEKLPVDDASFDYVVTAPERVHRSLGCQLKVPIP
jgi:hypothetical protein